MRISTYSVAALQGPPGIDSSFVDLGPAGQLGVGAAWARVAPGLRSVANQHDEIETWVVVAGEGEAFADAERLRVAAGTVIQFEPFETHFVENTGPTDLVFASFYWRDGERTMRAATGVEHRRFHERPVFVFGPPGAADVFVRSLRMTGAEAWHVAGAEDVPGPAARAFVDRLTASPAVAPGDPPAPPTLRLHELRADVEAHHRLGRVPAQVKEVAGRAFQGERLDVALTAPPIDAALRVLHGIEALGRRLGRDWRADAPQGDWKIVHFLEPDAVFAHAVLHPALYRLAYPEWTPDVDYHAGTAGAGDAPVDAWQHWLDDLGARIQARYGGAVRDAGIWTPEHTAFLARLDTRLSEMTGCLGPDGFSVDRAVETLSGIAEDAQTFARLQAPLAELDGWKDDARTAIALELAAAQLLATCGAPLVPEVAARLAAALGGPPPAEWPRRVALVKPGTRIGPAEEPPLLPWLSGLVRGVLRLADGESVRDRTLVALGMESLQAIALQYQILDQVGADVTIEDLLGTRDVAGLAAFIASGLAPEVVSARVEAVR